MANASIPGLPVAITLDGTEELEVVQPPGSGGTTKRATAGQIAGLAGLFNYALTPESVFGNPNATGGTAGTSIVGSASTVFRYDGSGQIGFGAIDITTSAAISGVLPVSFGGTGASSLDSGSLLLGNATGAVTPLANATSGYVLASNGTGAAPTFQQLSVTAALSGIVPVSFGGTGTSVLTAFGMVIGNGTSAVQIVTAGISGQLVISQGTASLPSYKTVTGDWTISSAGTATIATNVVTYAKIQTVPALSVVANASSATTNVTAVAGVANQALIVNPGGTAVVFGQLNLSSTSAITGTLASSYFTGILSVPFGGTGGTSLTAFGVLIGNGTSAVQITTAGTAGQVLVGQTATSLPIYRTVSGDLTLNLNGSAVIANGAVTYAKIQNVGALSVFGNVSSAATVGADVVGTANQVLRINPGGTALGFGQINLSVTAAVTGILPIIQGGTGASVAATAIINIGGLALATTGQALSGGVVLTTLSLGTATNSTVTLVAGNPPHQSIIINGTATLVAPSSDCEISLLTTNAGSAGVITFSGYSVGANTGDTRTTTNGSKFLFVSVTINGSSTYSWKAFQ